MTAATASTIGMSTPWRRGEVAGDRRRSREPSTSWFGSASATAAQRDAVGEVARLDARAGEHQVAEAGEAHQRFGAGAERLGEAAQFGEAARDQRGERAGAELAAGDDAGGDGEHVLHRAADLDADDVGLGVGAEGRASRASGRDRARSASSAAAMVTAVGRPRATSAAKLGPERIGGVGRRQRLGDDFRQALAGARAPVPWRR